jgi:hypothetical protein
MTNREFEQKIERLDVGLFDAIDSQSNEGDRRSWLAVQRVLRRVELGYTYLEIGSHVGGSLQQHVLDPRCRKIFSIDKRPLAQPDDRGQIYHYQGNSTERMLRNLRAICPEADSKVVCFDSDTAGLDPTLISEPADFCFIDGEHTREAVTADFEFCLRVSAPNGAICFHDASAVDLPIQAILRSLRQRAIRFRASKLGGDTFAVFLRDCPAPDDEAVKALSTSSRSWFRQRKLVRLTKTVLPVWLIPLTRPFGNWLRR